MSKILIWDELIPFENNDILVFPDNDFYEIYQNEDYVETPSFCYVLSQNYPEEMLPLLIYYLYLNHLNLSNYNNFLDNNPQFLIWETLIQSINSYDITSFKTNYTKLKDYPLYNQYTPLFEYIEQYFIHVIEPLSNSFYYKTTSSTKNKNWFLNNITTSKNLLNYIKVIEKKDKCNFLDLSLKIVEEKLNIFKKFNNNSSKLFYMSCYCYQLALNRFKLGQYQTAFILLHRTLDFYFQFRAFDSSIIVPTNNGMKFDYTDKYKSKPVGVYNLERCLIDSGDMTYDKDRATFISWLNETRNTLILTHGVFNVEKSNVEDGISKTLLTIERIEGTKYWETVSQKLSLTSNFNYKLLFDLEPSIELYFKQQEILV